MSTVGSRVAAMMSAKHGDGGGLVKLFGYGTYQGEKVPPKDRPGDAGRLGKMNIPNPEILLDSGETVYGCECWWGDALGFDKKYKDYAVQTVSINKELGIGE